MRNFTHDLDSPWSGEPVIFHSLISDFSHAHWGIARGREGWLKYKIYHIICPNLLSHHLLGFLGWDQTVHSHRIRQTSPCNVLSIFFTLTPSHTQISNIISRYFDVYNTLLSKRNETQAWDIYSMCWMDHCGMNTLKCLHTQLESWSTIFHWVSCHYLLGCPSRNEKLIQWKCEIITKAKHC